MSYLLPSSYRCLLIRKAGRIAHQVIKKPCIQVTAYDQVPSWSNLPQIFQYRVQFMCFRQISFYKSQYYLVRSRLVGVNYIRLRHILDPEALLQEIFMCLVLQACLSVPWKACVLRRQDLRFKQWIQHQLCCVPDQLMHDT